MQDERTTDEGQAAIRAAMQILSQARRRGPAQVAAPLPRLARPRSVRIGGAEFELDKLSLLVVGVVGTCAVMALAHVSAQSLVETEDRALALLTAPDVSAVHLVPDGGFAADAQATYWAKSGADAAVLTLANLRPISGGIRYHWWARHGDKWIALGGGTLHGEDHIRRIATSKGLSAPADAVWVTLEVADADPTLVNPTALAWPNQ